MICYPISPQVNDPAFASQELVETFARDPRIDYAQNPFSAWSESGSAEQEVLRPVLAAASISAPARSSAARLSEMPKASVSPPKDADLERVIPESARARGRAIAADPERARTFLQRAGIIDDSGQLTRNYR